MSGDENMHGVVPMTTQVPHELLEEADLTKEDIAPFIRCLTNEEIDVLADHPARMSDNPEPNSPVSEIMAERRRRKSAPDMKDGNATQDRDLQRASQERQERPRSGLTPRTTGLGGEQALSFGKVRSAIQDATAARENKARADRAALFQEFIQRRRLPQYDDEQLPEVQVTFKIYTLADLDTTTSQFFADFGVMLDWVDRCVGRDLHFSEDYHTGKLNFFPNLEEHIFNPVISLDNAVEDIMPLPGADKNPRIVAETNNGIWCKKTMRFRGRLSCNEVDYLAFPFDVQALPIRVKSSKWNKFKANKLADPKLRMNAAHHPEASASAKQFLLGHRIEEGRIHLGEMAFQGFGARKYEDDVSREPLRSDTYEIVLIMSRRFWRHVFNFVILIVMVFVAAASIFCTMETQALANRLSISLTVLLSLVAFTTQRPSAIEHIPYSTFHDNYVQFCVLCTVVISVLNWGAVTTCNDLSEWDGIKDVTSCHPAECGSTRFDCNVLYTLISCIVGFHLWKIWEVHGGYKRIIVRWQRLCGVKSKLPPQHSLSDVGKMAHDMSDSDRKSVRTSCSGTKDLMQSLSESGSSEEQQELQVGFYLKKGTKQELKAVHETHSQRSESPTRRASTWKKMKSSAYTMGSNWSLVSRSNRDNDDFKEQALARMRQVPAVAEDGSAHVLDLGGGEIGYYYYRLDEAGAAVLKGGRKLKWNGFVDAVHGLEVEFLLDYLEKETTEHFGKVAVGSVNNMVVGLTGSVRDQILAGDTAMPAQLQTFFDRLQATWTARTNQQWEIRHFMLPQKQESEFERTAISWLLENTDLRLHESSRNDPELNHYMHRELSSWILMNDSELLGQLGEREFIERFVPLSSQQEYEDRLQETQTWFELADVDNSGFLTIEEITHFVCSETKLLQAVIRERLFVGTLSGGTNSLQLTMRDSKKAREVRLFPAKIGNHSPAALGIFENGKTVSWKELSAWRKRVTTTLEGESPHNDKPWAKGLRGIFIGISSMYYAAAGAGIAEQLITKQTALKALRTHLEKGMTVDVKPEEVASHQQFVANMTMAIEAIDYTLHEDAWLYFRRTWKRGQETLVSTWSLGWFLRGSLDYHYSGYGHEQARPDWKPDVEASSRSARKRGKLWDSFKTSRIVGRLRSARKGGEQQCQLDTAVKKQKTKQVSEQQSPNERYIVHGREQ